jgi:hypothetical protein
VRGAREEGTVKNSSPLRAFENFFTLDLLCAMTVLILGLEAQLINTSSGVIGSLTNISMVEKQFARISKRRASDVRAQEEQIWPATVSNGR